MIGSMLVKQSVSIPAVRAPARTLAGAVVGAVMVGVLAACHAPGPTKPTPPARLELIRSGTLTVPDACSANGSVIVAFTVYEGGQTGDIQPAAAPACLQQALTAWVASFRYSPQSARVPTSIEWLLVEAKKGS